MGSSALPTQPQPCCRPCSRYLWGPRTVLPPHTVAPFFEGPPNSDCAAVSPAPAAVGSPQRSWHCRYWSPRSPRPRTTGAARRAWRQLLAQGCILLMVVATPRAGLSTLGHSWLWGVYLRWDTGIQGVPLGAGSSGRLLSVVWEGYRALLTSLLHKQRDLPGAPKLLKRLCRGPHRAEHHCFVSGSVIIPILQTGK